MPAKKASRSLTLKSTSDIAIPANLLGDVRDLIVTTRENVSRGVNAALVLLYWKVGERIRRDVLKQKRAGYGEQIVSTLSRELTVDSSLLRRAALNASSFSGRLQSAH